MNLHVNDEKYLMFMNNIQNILINHQNDYNILKENTLLLKKKDDELKSIYIFFHTLSNSHTENLSQFNILEKSYFTKKELLDARNIILNNHQKNVFEYQQIFVNDFPWIINPNKSITWNVSIYNVLLSAEIDKINNKYHINFDSVKNNIDRERLAIDIVDNIKAEILFLFHSTHYSYNEEEFNALLNRIRQEFTNMILKNTNNENLIISSVRKYINKLRKNMQ